MVTCSLHQYSMYGAVPLREIKPDLVFLWDEAWFEVLLERLLLLLLPDPARARVRVYSTQPTHKTLTSLRQGSMIHVTDQDFSQKAEETFHEAYMTHTSTSPNWRWRVSSWSRSRSRTRCGSAARSIITRC